MFPRVSLVWPDNPFTLLGFLTACRVKPTLFTLFLEAPVGRSCPVSQAWLSFTLHGEEKRLSAPCMSRSPHSSHAAPSVQDARSSACPVPFTSIHLHTLWHPKRPKTSHVMSLSVASSSCRLCMLGWTWPTGMWRRALMPAPWWPQPSGWSLEPLCLGGCKRSAVEAFLGGGSQ